MYVAKCEWCNKKCTNGIVRTNWWNHLLVIDDFSKTFCSRRCRTMYQNQMQKEAKAKDKPTQEIRQKRQPIERQVEHQIIHSEPIEHHIKTKEEIDLEYYEKQKQFEFEQQQQQVFAQKEQYLLDKEKAKYDDAKKYLADGGNKFIYYYKILWAFLDKTWKKVLFFILLWWIIASIIEPFTKK